ncbi:MAG: SCO family protein [Zoogloea sp.]|nr:SCO family protein [Zoogloea sp.]
MPHIRVRGRLKSPPQSAAPPLPFDKLIMDGSIARTAAHAPTNTPTTITRRPPPRRRAAGTAQLHLHQLHGHRPTHDADFCRGADTPRQLKDYARQFGADDSGLFLTGSSAASASVQKAFNAYRQDKMGQRAGTVHQFIDLAPRDRHIAAHIEAAAGIGRRLGRRAIAPQGRLQRLAGARVDAPVSTFGRLTGAKRTARQQAHACKAARRRKGRYLRSWWRPDNRQLVFPRPRLRRVTRVQRRARFALPGGDVRAPWRRAGEKGAGQPARRRPADAAARDRAARARRGCPR